MDPNHAAEAVNQASQVVVTVQPFMLELITLAKALILPLMFAVFAITLFLRALIYYTVQREDWFAKEFEKRANQFLRHDDGNSKSFFPLVKRLLEQTYYETFELRAKLKRRKFDYIMAPSDRIFMIQTGTAFLVRDFERELEFVKYDGNHPPLLEITQDVFSNNPCFTRILGLLPIGAFNDMLNVIPGLFIVAGIFGTFLGIMQALPELGAMDIRNPDSTKLVMDTFLAKIAFSMSTSTVGIMLSVVTTVYNNFLSPERLFVRIVERFERNLFRLWSRCDKNEADKEATGGYNAYRDPVEELAAMAVRKAIGEAEAKRVPNPDPRTGPTSVPTPQAVEQAPPPPTAQTEEAKRNSA